MRKTEVDLYAKYTAKVAGRLVTVRITSEHRLGGWTAINEQTGRPVRIKERRAPAGACVVSRAGGHPCRA